MTVPTMLATPQPASYQAVAKGDGGDELPSGVSLSKKGDGPWVKKNRRGHEQLPQVDHNGIQVRPGSLRPHCIQREFWAKASEPLRDAGKDSGEVAKVVSKEYKKTPEETKLMRKTQSSSGPGSPLESMDLDGSDDEDPEWQREASADV